MASRRAPTERARRGAPPPPEDPDALQPGYRRLFEACADAVFMTDAGGRILDANAACGRLLGCSREEVLGTAAPALWAEPGRRAEFLALLASDGAVRDFEAEFRRRDGTGVTCLVTAHVWRDERSHEPRLVGFVRDASELVRARRLARSREQLLERVFEGIRILVALMDRDFDFLRVNTAYAAADGRPPEDFVGRNHFALYPDPENERVFREVVATGRPFVAYERPFQYPEHPERGTTYWDWRIEPLKDERGEVNSVLLTLIDVTERAVAKRRLEEAAVALRRETQELERRVEERTAELAAANRELEAFTYSVSHDLRTPLHALIGFSVALLDEFGSALDPQAHHWVERIRAGSQRMGRLIDDLLYLSRVTRGDLRRTEVDLAELARDVMSELREADPGRIVELVLPPTLPAEGDRELLRVVVANLLGNAWKFTSGHARARIELGRTPADEGGEFFVRDDGAGFDMRYASTLFGPFQRLHAAEEFEGTGIGLATVRRILRRHGGSIRAEAEVERGATFYFTLGAGRDAA